MPGPDVWRIAIERTLGPPDGHARYGETDYWCPFCSRSHLHINYTKKKAICHGCRRKFKTLISLINAIGADMPTMRLVDGDEDLVEIVDEIADHIHAEEDDTPVNLPDGFHKIRFGNQGRLERIITEYLAGRGFTRDDITELGVGYCDSGGMRGYAVFPVTIMGKLVTWTSRRVTGFGPKQLHAPNAKARRALFNYDRCGDCRRLIMTEGPFDAKACHARIRPDDGGLGLLGTSLSDEKAQLIADLPATDYVVLMDGDGPGRRAAAEIALKLIAAGRAPRLAEPPDGIDPDEMSTKDLGRIIDSAEPIDEMDIAVMDL